MAKLILRFKDALLEEVKLKQGDMSVGRRPGSDIQIDNLAVSGNHATIVTIGEESFIQDLESTNGTFINGRKITKHHLKHGDVVTIGKHSLTYVSQTVQKPVDDFVKTVVLNGQPTETPPERAAAIFILSGANSGKRIDLTKAVTNLGTMGKSAGTIKRKDDGYVLMAVAGGDVPKLNGKSVVPAGEALKNGDIIEIGEARLQFHLK